MAVGTLLPGLSTLDKWSREGKFETSHEMERELKNTRIQLLAEICLYLQGKIQSLAHTLLESYYDFMMKFSIHMDEEISILSCQGFSEKNNLSLLSNHLRQIFDDLYQARIMERDKLGSFNLDETAVVLW